MGRAKINDHEPASPDLGKRLRIMMIMRITKINDLGLIAIIARARACRRVS